MTKKKKVLPWSRVAEVCRRLGKKHRVKVPEVLERVSGDVFDRHQQRLEGLADFLEALSPPEKPMKESKKDETSA